MNQSLDQKKTYSVIEAAKILGVHPETVRRAIREDNLPASRFGNRGHYRIASIELDRFIKICSKKE